MQKAIIVGASSGIGRELALVLSQQGYEIGLVARRFNLLIELQNEIQTKTYIKQIDIANCTKAIHLIQDLIQKMKGVDLFIIDAGVGFINPELDWNKEQETLEINALGFCAMANVAMQYFLKQEKGHLVGISSISAIRGHGSAPAYNASKAFVSSYLEGLRHKVSKSKKEITITDIKPGFVDTDMAKGQGVFWVASTRKAAHQIVQAIQKKQAHVYITRRWRAIAWLLKILPNHLYDRWV